MYQENHRLRNIIAVGIGLFIVVIAIISYLYYGSNTKSNIKQTISEQVHLSNFEVDKILKEDGNWVVASLSTGDNNDNKSLAILYQNKGKYELRYGPGTNFDRFKMEADKVPQPIIDVVFSGQKTVSDKISQSLPYKTNFYEVSYAGKNPETNKTMLSLYIYEIPRLGIYVTNENYIKYSSEIKTWIKSLGLDPSNYEINLNNY